MSIKINATPPIMEIVFCKLFGIESVPIKEQRLMVARCARAVNKYHEEEIAKLKTQKEGKNGNNN